MINKKTVLLTTVLTMMTFQFLLLKGSLIDIPFGTHKGGIIAMKYTGIILFLGFISIVLIHKYYPKTSK